MPDFFSNIKKSVKEYVQSTKTSDGRSALHLVVVTNISAPVQTLLDAGVPRDGLDAQGNTPLHLAAAERAAISLKTLLTYQSGGTEKEEDKEDSSSSRPLSPDAELPMTPNSDVSSYLSAASTALPPRYVDLKNNLGETALHLACKANCVQSVQTLLEHQGDMYITTYDGKLPIHYAIQNSSLECAEYLFTLDRDLVFTDSATESLLHAASTKEMVELLITQGIDVKAHDSEGKTVIHTAVAKKRFKLLLSLMLCQVSASLRDTHNNTALHTAVQENSDPLYVKLLVVFGVDTAARNSANKTAYELAVAQDKEEHMALLASIGAHDPVFLARAHCWDSGSQERSTQTPRKRSKWSGRDAAVLCVDGGGIRGLISTQLLLEIEYRTQTHIEHLFDWISGTSTGALLLSAVVYSNIGVKGMQSVYFDVKNKVYQGSRPYDSSTLEREIQHVVGEIKMKCVSYPRTIIPTTVADVRPCMLQLFTNYGQDQDEFVWKACRASGAAPTYFSAFEQKYLDGGVMANNPTMTTLSEMRKYYNGDEVSADEPCKPKIVVSVGNGQIPTERVDNICLGYVPRNPIDAARYVTGAVEMLNTLVEQTTNCDGPCSEAAKYWCESVESSYYRLQTQLETNMPLNETNDIQLINMCWDTCVYIYLQREQFKELSETLIEGLLDDTQPL